MLVPRVHNVKRPAPLKLPTLGQPAFGAGLGGAPPMDEGGAFIQSRSTVDPNTWQAVPTSPLNSGGLDDLYPETEKRALKKITEGKYGDLEDLRDMRLRTNSDPRAARTIARVQPQSMAMGYSGPIPEHLLQYSQSTGGAAGFPAPASPVPMTADEMESYNRRARKAATHAFLSRAKVCLNCEWFLAYTRGTDKQHLNLCRFNGTSPWDKSFTCGTSYCNDYLEIGSDIPDDVKLPEKKKRRRRSRAEIEAFKGTDAPSTRSETAELIAMSRKLPTLDELGDETETTFDREAQDGGE